MRLFRLLALAGIAAAMVGCGMKGDLYLPTPAPKPQPSQSVQPEQQEPAK